MTFNDGALIGVTQIFGSAPQESAFNLVLMAEGFQADEQIAFNVAADAVVAELVKTAPFVSAVRTGSSFPTATP